MMEIEFTLIGLYACIFFDKFQSIVYLLQGLILKDGVLLFQTLSFANLDPQAISVIDISIN